MENLEIIESGDVSIADGANLLPAKSGSSRRPSEREGGYWIVVRARPARRGHRQPEALTAAGGELAVFSFREEAEIFLSSRAPSGDWRVREFYCGELVSMLYGTFSNFDEIALDPLPETANRAMDALVSVGRKEFAGLLARRICPPSHGPPRSNLSAPDIGGGR